MKRNDWTEEENKIANLIYTNDPVNDRLVLEIVKNRQKPIGKFLPILFAVAVDTNNENIASEYLTFLKNKISDLLYKITSSNNNSGLVQSKVKTEFTQQERAEMHFTHFKRKTSYGSDFLKVASWDHPGRKEVFESYLGLKLKNEVDSIELIQFTEQELKIFLNHPEVKFSTNCSLTIENKMSFDFPKEIFEIPFGNLTIKNFISDKFPAFIFHFTSIKHLYIHGTGLQNFQDDWSSLSKLENLIISESGHVFKNFDFIVSLPNLKRFSLYWGLVESPFALITQKKIPLHYEPKFQNKESFEVLQGGSLFGLPFKEVLSIGTAIGKSKLSQSEKEHYFRMITSLKKLKNLPELSVQEYAAISTISNTALRNICTNRLSQIAEKGSGTDDLKEKSLIWFLGTTSTKKTDLARDLKELKLQSTFKFSNEVTHVVIGKNPKDYSQLKELNFKLLSENQIAKHLSAGKPKFIQEAAQSGNNSLSEKVVSMLLSPEPANVKVGLELLKTGGVPPNLMEDLLIVQKTCPDTSARKTAKKLLEQNAPADLLPLVNDSQRFTSILTEKAQATNKKLESFARKNSRELAAKLSLIFHQKLGRGLRYILYHFHVESEIRSGAMSALVEDNCFNLTKGLGFKTWTNPEEAILFNLKIPAKITFEVGDKHPNIEKAILHNCKMTKLPSDVSKLKNLKHLDCSYNFLGSIPKSIGEIENLETLDLKMNQFKTFPETVRHAKNLKLLDLRFNRPDGHTFKSLEITEKVKAALPDCEILV